VLLNLPLPLPKGQCFERMAWGPDGTIAAAVGGHIHFIDSKTGQVRVREGSGMHFWSSYVWCQGLLRTVVQAAVVKPLIWHAC
jgi:hypothetical protein